MMNGVVIVRTRRLTKRLRFLLKDFYGVCLPKTLTGTMGQAEAENALFGAGHMCSDIIE